MCDSLCSFVRRRRRTWCDRQCLRFELQLVPDRTVAELSQSDSGWAPSHLRNTFASSPSLKSGTVQASTGHALGRERTESLWSGTTLLQCGPRAAEPKHAYVVSRSSLEKDLLYTRVHIVEPG